MEAVLASPAFSLMLSGFLVVALLFRKREKVENILEPAHIKQVREWVSQGNFKEAAALQAKHGNLEEALNLYQKCKCYEDASHIAEKLGSLNQAAKMAEKAKDYQRAAELYLRLQQPQKASQAFAKGGNYERAAQLMEQNTNNQDEQVARMWEKALLSETPQSPLVPTQAAQKMQNMAHKAASHYEKAGNHKRAIRLYEMSQQHEKASQLREEASQGNKPTKSNMPPSDFMSGFQQEEAQLDSQLMAGPSFQDLAPALAPAPPRTHSLSLDNMPRFDPSSLPQLPQVPHASMASMSQLAMPSMSQLAMPSISQLAMPSMSQLAMPSSSQIMPSPPRSNAMPSLSFELPLVPQKPQRSTRSSQRRGMQVQRTSMPQSYSHTSLKVHEENQRYTLGEKLGEGGMATVNKAFDQKLERDVALKLFPKTLAQSDEELTYFEQEAKAAATLNHPNIVTIYDYGILNHQPFICMELVEGATLEELLDVTEGEGVDLLSFFEVADGLLTALAFAHSHDFVHRDIKPANVMYTTQGFIKLMDFGIARKSDEEESDSTFIAGTPRYMAPEQMIGRGVDQRSDLFAVGVTLYELVTCVPAFEGLARDALPPPPHLLREFPSELEQMLLWCLHPDPDHRPQTAEELRVAFQKVRKELEDDPVFQTHLKAE